MENDKHSALWLIGRSLLPSAGSILGSLVLALALFGFHLLLLSNDVELFLPHVAGRNDDQLAAIYETNILGPLNNLFGSSMLGTVSTLFVWGVVGLAAYSLLEFVAGSYREWRQGKSEISVQTYGKVVRHPLYSQVALRLVWRFALIVLAVAALAVFRPLISSLFAHDIEFLKAPLGPEMLKHLGIVIGGWLLVFHVYVVIFRLFVFRTRVFGEIIY